MRKILFLFLIVSVFLVACTNTQEQNTAHDDMHAMMQNMLGDHFEEKHHDQLHKHMDEHGMMDEDMDHMAMHNMMQTMLGDHFEEKHHEELHKYMMDHNMPMGEGMMGHMMMASNEEFLPEITNQQATSTSILELNDGDEVDIIAQTIMKEINGKSYAMYGYNGQIPGPFFKVQKGATVTVHFTNQIDQETTVHWHGLRHDIKNDGVPGVSQDPIQPGETYPYTVTFPDTGIFWYHPHIREDLQQDLGLYGNMLVQETNYFNLVNREEVLVLDDILIDDNGLVPFGKDHATHALMGRFGNIMLVNGNTDYQLQAKKGEIIRFYITNVANTRTFNLVIPGAKIKLVGSDLGKYERETFVDSLVISPAERYIVEVYFEKAGEYILQNQNPEKTYDLAKVIVEDEAVEKDFSNTFPTLKEDEETIADINAFRPYFNKEVDYEIELTMNMGMMMQGMMNNKEENTMPKHLIGEQHIMKKEQDAMMMNMDDMPCHQMNGEWMGNCENREGIDHGMMRDTEPIEWEDDMIMMNAMSTSENTHWILKDKASGKENMDIKYTAKVGDKIKIRLFNNPESMHPMQHPIHLHGQRFLVLNVDGEENQNLVWKDTVLVPTGSTVDILVDITNPGEWMLHCHIAEHLTAGMMTSLTVEG